jgi:hypothetical protein
LSQFHLPRVNFQGAASLDAATANNGNYEPSLTMFDQDNSQVFLPPRCYLKPKQQSYIPPPGIEVLTDDKGRKYIPIEVIHSDNYQDWAVKPLGSYDMDVIYHPVYEFLKLTGKTPGYWNYFGDLSMSLNNVLVSGITILDGSQGAVNYTPDSQNDCPEDLRQLFGSELSFNSNYFSPGSRSSAYMSDVDSIGQMCTQIFCGQAGLYKTSQAGQQISFFTGKPVKSTSRWLNLNKVINYSDLSLTPMGGSACFYSKIDISGESELIKLMSKYSGKEVKALFLKIMIHQVYEVREPDYSMLIANAGQSKIPKNPATCKITGSITPFYEGDMNTGTLCRILKSQTAITVDVTNIPVPITKKKQPLTVPQSVNLAPIQLIHQAEQNLLSVDILNTISEYGTTPGAIAPYAGNSDIPGFTEFESYNFGSLMLFFQLDAGGQPVLIKDIDFQNYYNAKILAETAGIIDIPVAANADYSQGSFYIAINNDMVFNEDDYFITSDQMGNYAQQNQDNFLYMSDGLPRIPCSLRVLYRGVPVLQEQAVAVIQQCIDLRAGSIINIPNTEIYDGIIMNFAVDKDGCITYAFIDSHSTSLSPDFSNIYSFVMSNALMVVRTLESKTSLDTYLNGNTQITWDVVFDNVFVLFKALYPVMDIIVPFTEANWSDPFMLNKMLVLTDDQNWDQPLYMPVTRDLSDQQRQLLKMWADQIINQ